jgi:hypothetical protein
MKPISHISRQFGRLAGERSPVQLRSRQLLTDYHFHTNGMPAGGTGGRLSPPALAPGFRKLSYEFLGAETRRSYVAEVLFFAIIVGVSVWPIASMLQALGQLLK